MTYTDDPVKDYEKYYDDLERKLEELPLCSECGEHIQEEMCYEINGEYMCDTCMDMHRTYTPGY